MLPPGNDRETKHFVRPDPGSAHGSMLHPEIGDTIHLCMLLTKDAAHHAAHLRNATTHLHNNSDHDITCMAAINTSGEFVWVELLVLAALRT